MIVDKNYYTNLKNFYIFFLGKFKKLSNVAQDFDANLYPVNNFFHSLGKKNRHIKIWDYQQLHRRKFTCIRTSC